MVCELEKTFVIMDRATKAEATGIGYLYLIGEYVKLLGAKRCTELLLSNKDVGKIGDNTSFSIRLVKEK